MGVADMPENIHVHKFLGLPGAKPRVWVDLSSAASKRAGLAMHSPGRKLLRWAVKILSWFAWLPIETILRGPVKRFDELDGHEVIERAVGSPIEYMTLYMGNDSAKTKLTVLVKTIKPRNTPTTRNICHPFCVFRVFCGSEKNQHGIVKLGQTPEAGEAIRNEVEVLKKFMGTPLCAQVPVVQGDVGTEGVWTWSVQSVLPKGKSPVRMQREHYEFLDELKRLGISHGDFAPWNCSIVGGKLYVWDWEDAGSWVDGKDESWFKGQVKKLLGIDA